MRHFGFNPFVKGEESGHAAVIYDLLNAEHYVIDVDIFQAFYGKRYKPLVEIESVLKKKFGIKEVERIINEGKASGLIVETGRPYFREEIKNHFDKAVNAGNAVFFLRNILLQPTGICHIDCDLCSDYINCLCRRNENEWSKNDMDKLFYDLDAYKNRLGAINIIGGDILNYVHLDYLILKISQLEKADAVLNVLVTGEKIDRVSELMNRLSACTFSGTINFKIHTCDSKVTADVLGELGKIDTNTPGIKVGAELLIDRIDEDIVYLVEGYRDKFCYFNWEFLYDRQLRNIDKLRTSNIDIFSEKIDFNEFYFRKNSHRCWGFSVSINSRGEIKPCLWSKTTFDRWANGSIKHYLSSFDHTYKFWLDSSLKKHPRCGECVLKYSCKHCRVIDEYEPGIYGKICENRWPELCGVLR